ncbi:MAG: efflux RND transporter periplasmic adaptor subunit [Longimicrobiales bacterium]|nr:efflux RND transporter periplasmic adaptor subunit [Longimicrobiales bacterium]
MMPMTMNDPSFEKRRVHGWGMLALLLMTGLSACTTGDEPGALPPSDEAVSVTLSPVLTLPAMGSHPATVEATEKARLATRISGRIERVAVDVGRRVSRGDLLVALDDSDVQARIEAASAGVRLARRTWERIEALASDGAASEQELDEARTRLEAAEADLRTARAQVDYTDLVAPFDGVVTTRSADPGDLAAPGHPLVTLVGTGGLKVVADLPAGLIGAVDEGDSVRVVEPGTGKEITVPIRRIVPAISASARRFRIQAELPEEADLLPGAFVRLATEQSGEATRWIPEDALVRRGQLVGVFTVEEETLRLRWIRPGERRPGAVELLAGPEGPVVREPAPTWRDGQRVTSSTESAWAGPGREEIR